MLLSAAWAWRCTSFAGLAAGALSRTPRTFEVVFEREEEAERAVYELDGAPLGSTDIVVSINTAASPAVSVYVQDVTEEIDENDVRQAFEQCGNVVRVRCELEEKFGQVRYEHGTYAWRAKNELDGSELCGKRVRVELDCTRKELDTILVHGIGSATRWKQLRDHFQQCGSVKFAAVHGGPSARVEFTTGEAARRAITAFHSDPSKRRGIQNVVWPWDCAENSTALTAHGVDTRLSVDELVRRFNATGTVVSAKKVFVELPPEFLV